MYFIFDVLLVWFLHLYLSLVTIAFVCWQQIHFICPISAPPPLTSRASSGNKSEATRLYLYLYLYFHFPFLNCPSCISILLMVVLLIFHLPKPSLRQEEKDSEAPLLIRLNLTNEENSWILSLFSTFSFLFLKL